METIDNVNHPTHYNMHPSGIECIEIARYYPFSVGNAIKYIWRAGIKQDPDKDSIDKEIEDIKKAIWYLDDRVKELETFKIRNSECQTVTEEVSCEA